MERKNIKTMGKKGGDRNTMSGKSRRKKGETAAQHRARVDKWSEGLISKKCDFAPVPETRNSCFRCETWIENIPRDGRGQCFLNPGWIITASNHYCGKFKNNNKHILGEL